MAAQARTLVLGVGNLLMGDEGAGVHLAQRLLAGAELPTGAEVLDGGTGGFTLLEALTACPRAIIMDACLDGKPPGTLGVKRARRAAHFPTALGAHDIGVRALVEAAELLGALPRMLLVTISVQPPFRMGLELSAPVAAALPGAERLVRRLLARGPRAWIGPLSAAPGGRAERDSPGEARAHA